MEPRHQDLEKYLASDYELLNKLEDRLRSEVDPCLKLRWKEDINKVKLQIRQLEEKLKSPPQKILILAAIPQGLRLDKEIREIEEAIRRATKRDLFEIRVRNAVRPQDIRRAIAEERPQIVHFCGHGLNDGSLLLEDDGGNDKSVAPEALASLFKLHADYVECVLLNACYSEKSAGAISQNIDYVIGMNNPIQDKAAIEFAKGFYDGLGYVLLENQDIFQRAFDEAMVAIQMEENLSQRQIPIFKIKEKRFRVLFLSANPRRTSQLRLDEEMREIKEGLRRSRHREQYDINTAEAVRYRDIHRAILDYEPNIVHFSGHGISSQGRGLVSDTNRKLSPVPEDAVLPDRVAAEQEGLVFEDETGHAKLVDAEALAGLFELFADQVECVVLNACYSKVQAQEIAQHINYVIGMSQAIGDIAAIEFAVGFYDALGAGRSVEFAYSLGCNSIQLAGVSEKLTPQILKKKEQKRQLREQYFVFSKQIRQSLYESNSAIFTQFPPAHRDFILQEFRKEFDFLKLVYHHDTVTLEGSERDRINGFSEAWRQAEIAMQQHEIEKFRNETDRLTYFLCQALNFNYLKHPYNSATQGQFYGRMIDASNPAFSLNIRPEFPVIYTCQTQYSEEDVVMGVMGLLHRFKIEANFFALLIVFSNFQEFRQKVRESAHKNDCIVLTYNHLWDILTAKAPIQQLTVFILEQIDLVFLSPYTVGGPVPEKMFFGRAEEEKTLLQNIGRKDYALLGNRKSGKTSLLNQIYSHLQNISNYQVFYCDLQAVNDYETFYLELFLSYPKLEEKVGKITMLSPSIFYKLVHDIKRLYSKKKIIFIFDEVDEILAYDLHKNEQLFKVFRSLSQRKNIRFIFSGTTTLVKRTSQQDSPLFNFCNPIKLGLLEEKAARELVTVPMGTLGVKFDNESASVQRILDLTAQHPNVIQYICSELIQKVNKKPERTIDEQDLNRVLTSQEFYDYFERLIWGQSTALEKLIVYAMWSYPELTESEVIEKFKRWKIPSEAVKSSLEILLTYSTLSKNNDNYFFTFHEFAKLMEERSDIPALIVKYQREVGGSEAW